MTHRPTVLTVLEQERDTVVARLKAVAAETDPWTHEGRYIADAMTCSVERGRTTEYLMREHDRLDSAIAEECCVQYGWFDGRASALPLATVAAVLREVAA